MSPLEPDLPGIRRLEAPVMVDRRGTVWALGLIDVTVRYGDRTVLAESPPPGLTPELGRSLREAALRFAGAKGKAGAFTVSFLADVAKGEHRFTGTASGLPEAVALLEALNEVDLPALEAHLSRGGTLDGAPPESRGHALQVSLAALDPEDGFAPRPGTMESLRLPAGAGLRADPAVEEGGSPSAPGHAIARITGHGRTRAEALTRLQRGLALTEAVVRGGTTDKAFLAEVLDRPELAGGDAEPGWLDRLVASGEHLPHRGAEVALLAAAIAGYEADSAMARERFFASAARGRLEVPQEAGFAIALRHRGYVHRFRVARLGHDLFRIEVDGRRLEVRAGPPGRTGRSLACGEKSWRVSLISEGSRQLVEVDGIPHRLDQAEGEEVPSPAPADERRARFDGLEAAPEASPLEEARRLMLGYDIAPEAVERLLSSPAGPPSDPFLEEEILQAFVAVSALFGRQPVAQTAEDGRHSAVEYLFIYLRDLDSQGAGLPAAFLDKLRHALSPYGVGSLDRSPDLEESLFCIAVSHQGRPQQVPSVLALLERWLERGDRPRGPGFRNLLERMIAETQGSEPAVHDLAREVRYRLFDRTVLLAARERVYSAAQADLARLAESPGPAERAERTRSLVDCTQPLHRILSQHFESAASALRETLLEVMVRRYYRIRELRSVSFTTVDGIEDQIFAIADYDYQGSHVHLIATHPTRRERLVPSLAAVRQLAGQAAPGSEIVADLYFWDSGPPVDEDTAAAGIAALLESPDYPQDLRRVAVTASFPDGMRNFTFRRSEEAGGAFREERIYRGIHPMMALRLQLWRLASFHLERLPSPEGIYFFRGVAHDNPRDERLFAVAEVRDLTPLRDASSRVVQLPQLEHMLMESLAGIRRFQAHRATGERLQWNRVLLYVWPPVDLRPDELDGLVHRLSPLTEGLGLEKVAVRARIPDPQGGELRDRVLEISKLSEGDAVLRFRKPREVPLKPLREYAQRVVDLRRRGLPYPYEVIKLLTPRRDARADLPAGEFVEHDLDASGRLVPMDRPYGGNVAGVVVGVVRNFTDRYPEGMARVILLSDPSRDLGALAEPECRRILAALDLAAGMGAPLEWFAFSSGGLEDKDWNGRVLRRLVEFTRSGDQPGGEINVVIMGLNAGVQPCWIDQATLPMHTRGIVITTSGEEAQYSAKDLGEACRILLRYYEHAYVAPGERFPRPAATGDPRHREISFDGELRHLMATAVDQDHEPLERWYGMRDAESAVVWDAHLGGRPVCLLGFESLVGLAAKKVARALHAASGSRPLVVLANLADLGNAAEIARAVVSFQGPIVVCDLSRPPAGTFAASFPALHDNLQMTTLEEIASGRLRSWLIEAVERGMARKKRESPGGCLSSPPASEFTSS